MIQIITEFADFLNENGYSITPSKITSLFSLIKTTDADITNEAELVSLMRICFCVNRWQSEGIAELFHSYIERKRSGDDSAGLLKKIESSKSDLESQRKEWSAKKQSRLDDIKKIEKEIEKKKKELEDSATANEDVLTKKEHQFLEKNRQDIEGWKIEGLCEALYDLKKKDIKRIKKELLARAEMCMSNGDFTGMQNAKSVYDMISKIEKADDLMKKRIDRSINASLKPYQNKLDQMRQKLEEEQAAFMKTQNKLNEELQRLRKEQTKRENELIQKQKAQTHRQEFIGGHRAVQTFEDAPACIDKSFKQLTEKNGFRSKVTSRVIS